MELTASPNGPANATKSKLRSLALGIKRRMFRVNDEKAEKADAIFRSQRKGALERTNYRCVFCGVRSVKSSDVHHADDNHANNAPENLLTACKLCHPYNHVGEAVKPGQESGIFAGHIDPKALALIRVPDAEAIPASDMNHLQRAIGMALADPNEADSAKAVLALIASEANRVELVRAIFGDNATSADGKAMRMVNPTDVAAGLQGLTDDEYARRNEVLGAVRLIFHPRRLAEWGRLWRDEQPAFSNAASWEQLLSRTLDLTNPSEALTPSADEEDGIRPSTIMLDDDEDEDD